MARKKQKNTDSLTSLNLDNANNSIASTTFTMEAPKKEKPQDKTQKPKLDRDAKKELKLTGTFYAGIAELKVEKSDLELNRTQRIIFEENGVHYEYTRNKPPY